MTYSRNFGEAVVAYEQNAHTLRQTCETFKFAPQTYYNWLSQKQKTGNLQPKNTIKEKEKSTTNNYNTYKNAQMLTKKNTQKFNASAPAICKKIENLKITRKKTIYL
jgi:transposase